MASLCFKQARTNASTFNSSLLSFRRQYTGTSPAVAHSRLQEYGVKRELFINVLKANVTKRDARDFIARLRPSVSAAKTNAEALLPMLQQERTTRPHILYSPAEAKVLDLEQMHLALICFKRPEIVDDSTLDGFAVTVSQLVQLDMRIMIVLDSNAVKGVSERRNGLDIKASRGNFARQAERFCHTIGGRNPEGARSIHSAFEWVEPKLASEQGLVASPVTVANPDQLLEPLKRGSVLIVPAMAYTPSGQLLTVSSKDVMTGLTREFAPAKPVTSSASPLRAVDRVIIIDPIGGIPSTTRGNSAYNVINLEQPLDGFEQELSEYNISPKAKLTCPKEEGIYKQHWHNLNTMRKCLALLPPESSGLILTPAAAAANPLPANPLEGSCTDGEMGQKNLLIHNVLTNRPMVSPSLPTARLPSPNKANGHSSRAALPISTLVRRGMPLAVIPAKRVHGWQVPPNGRTLMKLEDDPRVDFSRLVHLINNSFRRKLDVTSYIARTRNRVAGVIVTGEYEGCAVFTWEMPPGTQDPTRLVPYLDKFAVLQSSQGSSGVADMLFQAMVESCFPNGVCWRSRKDNPVNKWYFERSDGSWKIPMSDWTMFWVGNPLLAKDRLNDYLEICKSVRQCWAGEESRSTHFGRQTPDLARPCAP